MTDTPDITPAPDELLALARAVRPEWDHEVLAAAVLAAKNAGWTWVRTLRMTVHLMCDPDASPWDLRRAAADPLRREPGKGDYGHGAALARDLMEHRNDPESAA